MAYAGALFADSCLRGLNGEQNVEEYAYVESDKTELPYFATKVRLGPNGESALTWSLAVQAFSCNCPGSPMYYPHESLFQTYTL